MLECHLLPEICYVDALGADSYRLCLVFTAMPADLFTISVSATYDSTSISAFPEDYFSLPANLLLCTFSRVSELKDALPSLLLYPRIRWSALFRG